MTHEECREAFLAQMWMRLDVYSRCEAWNWLNYVIRNHAWATLMVDEKGGKLLSTHHRRGDRQLVIVSQWRKYPRRPK